MRVMGRLFRLRLGSSNPLVLGPLLGLPPPSAHPVLLRARRAARWARDGRLAAVSTEAEFPCLLPLFLGMESVLLLGIRFLSLPRRSRTALAAWLPLRSWPVQGAASSVGPSGSPFVEVDWWSFSVAAILPVSSWWEGGRPPALLGPGNGNVNSKVRPTARRGGATVRRWKRLNLWQGLSPRGRGNRLFGRIVGGTQGSIPAWAGQPPGR